MKTTVLKLDNISKKLSDFFSLKNISLDLYEGEVHIILGENGSGKSSLLNVIWGTCPKDSGGMFINESPVSINSPVDAKKNQIAIIHQNSSLFEHFTVAENIYLDNVPYTNKTFRIIDWSQMFYNCQLLFEKLGFSLNPRSLVRDLNIAQKQLVEICKAYVSDAKIIMMDEPTASLTENESVLFYEIIKELKKSGVSILYISHKLEEIRQIGDRISVIRNGQLVGTVSINEMDIENIIKMMTGMDLRERYPKLSIKTGREVLRVDNLHYSNTLKNINFSLNKNEILGIIGLVGSGRTKIARCIFGLEKVDSGDIFINNAPVKINSPSDAIAAGIGYVTEDRAAEGLFMYLSVPENITAPNIQKISNRHIIDKTIENSITSTYINRLGIKVGTLNDRAVHLSGGNQQKVLLARWIMSKSKILILDEPTKGIDIASKVDMYNLMNEMVTKNVSIILISSDVDEVIGMCDRVIVLYDGRIASVMTRSNATREKILFYATGGR